MRTIHLSPPDMSERERDMLTEAFDSNWIAPFGPDLDHFEADMAEFVGVRHAVALNSATMGLHLALLELGVERDDEVYIPTLTFVATANAAMYIGAKPRFIDVSPSTWNIDPNLLAEELSVAAAQGRLPKAVMTVDLYGQCADHDAIRDVCAQYEVPIVSDAAESMGATYKGTMAGSHGTIGVTSFNGNKIMTTGGGGMLFTNNGKTADRVRYLAAQAREATLHYEHSEVGYNGRMGNLAAAIGRGQLTRIDDFVDRRARNRRIYGNYLRDFPGIDFMPQARYGKPNNWLTVATIDKELFGVPAAAIISALTVDGIDARPAWKPMHLQPVFVDAPTVGGAVAESIFRTGICLPSGSTLSFADQKRIVDVLRGCYTQPLLRLDQLEVVDLTDARLKSPQSEGARS